MSKEIEESFGKQLDYQRIISENDTDIPQILSIYQSPEIARYLGIDENNYFSYVTNSLNVYFFKVYTNKDFIGVVHLEKQEMILFMSIVVFPKFQRKGLGTQIIKDIQNGILKINYNRIEVSIDESNISSRKLFEKTGFIVISKEEELIAYIYEKTKQNIDNFSNRAEAYAKGRPGYAKECIDKIIELAPTEAIFADIGAGTGKLTKELAKLGLNIYAVEPNEDMRSQLVITLKGYSNVKIINGTGEHTTLSDKSVDVIKVAHTLYWFDVEAFTIECNRILKPNGKVIVIYNHVPGKEDSDFGRQTVDKFFANPIIWSFHNSINYTKDNWIAYIQSQDNSILPNENGYEDYIATLMEQFDKNSIDEQLQCDRLTRTYLQKDDI